MILIVSHRADPHVAMVTAHLDRLGAPWAFLAPMELGEGAAVSWRLDDDDEHAAIVADGREIPLGDVTAVWNRRFLRPHLGELAPDPLARQYAQEQWWHAAHGVLGRPGPRWVNPIAALARARSKPRQLVDAQRVGLRVPPTLVTTDPAAVRAFAAEVGGRIITKVVSPGTPIVAEGDEQYMIFTQRVDLDELHEGQIRAAPAIYQPEIDKSFEVRATIVGDHLLGCQIDSGASERTSLDWRHYDFDLVAHRPIELPSSVERSLLALCRLNGIRYGAADLIVGTDGAWTFLELNANGQWGWIEEQAGIPIAQHLANELMGCP